MTSFNNNWEVIKKRVDNFFLSEMYTKINCIFLMIVVYLKQFKKSYKKLENRINEDLRYKCGENNVKIIIFIKVVVKLRN